MGWGGVRRIGDREFLGCCCSILGMMVYLRWWCWVGMERGSWVLRGGFY